MSSLALYDKALYDKIHELFPNVINANEDSAFNDLLDQEMVDTKEKPKDNKNTKIVFPFISFWRTDNTPNLDGANEGNFVQMLKGRNEMVSSINGFKVRTFPIKINYQVSIWSDKRIEVDDIYQEFLMLFFVDEPYLTVKVVDTDFENEETNQEERVVLTEDFSLQLEDSSNTTDITSFSDRGRVYRQDIIIGIDNAKLFYLGDRTKVAKYIPVTINQINEKKGKV